MQNSHHHGISDYAARLIRHKARQLAGKAGFTRSDTEDIEQELAVDLLERLPKFDSAKATKNTFSACVIERKISNLIRHRTQQMRDRRRESFSLNDLIKDDNGAAVERGLTIDHEDAGFRRGTRRRTREEEEHLRLDVSLVISALPSDLGKLAELLKTHTITQAAEKLGVPRTTLYGAVERLRLLFEQACLGDYL
ncbi:MAG: RNA polymerase subunit sigma-24 [Planctomycetes bacterium]|nr:RNA polymerase subunit sigma-24 [Planctomycetota bacterium]